MTTYSVNAQDFLQRVMTAMKGSALPKLRTHILVACMPKSGSTFLTHAIANIPGMHRVTLGFGYHRREQELCLATCALMQDLNYVAQQHVRYSDATQKVLTAFGIYPVILMRNIFDSVVSFRDHLEREDAEVPFAYLPPHILELSKEKQFDVVIDLVVPWYANFFACWAGYKGPATRVLYRNFVKAPDETVSTILRDAGMETSRPIVDDAIRSALTEEVRFNVGRVGRGAEELTARQIARIRELFSNYSAFDGVEDILYLNAA